MSGIKPKEFQTTLVFATVMFVLLFSESLESCNLPEKNLDFNDSSWKLVYTTEDELLLLDKTQRSQRISYKDKATTGLTVNTKNNLVYWTDRSNENPDDSVNIYSISLHHTTSLREIVAKNVYATGLAFDWISNNIYFTERFHDRIGVCNPINGACTTLVNHAAISSPVDIAVYVQTGQIFWTSKMKRGDQSYSIFRAEMDGAFQKEIVSDVKSPVGIAVDEQNGRIYWVDKDVSRIDSCFYDGSHRTRVHFLYFHESPMGLTVFGSRMYWMDTTSRTIQSANKLNGSDTNVDLNLIKKSKLQGFHIMHSQIQPVCRANPCKAAKCSHICTQSPTSKGFRCFCPIGMILDVDSQTCVYDSPKLLMARENQFAILRYFEADPRQIEFDSFFIPIKSSIKTLLYNAIHHSVVFSQRNSSKIFQYDMRTRSVQVLVDQEKGRIEGFDIDYVGQNLYWIDSYKETVEVLSLKTKARAVVTAHVNQPTALLIANGQLFVAATENQTKIIFKIQMNGSNKIIISEMPHATYVSLAYDYETEQIIWTQNQLKGIHMIHINGTVSKKFPTNLPTENAVKIGDTIFWVALGIYNLQVLNIQTQTSFSLPAVSRYKKSSGSVDFSDLSLKITIVNQSHFNDLRKTRQCTPQSHNIRNCSHLCLQSNFSNFGECKCSENLLLFADGVTCLEWNCTEKFCNCFSTSSQSRLCMSPCPKGIFTCFTNNTCVISKKICDGSTAGDDRSDERNATDEFESQDPVKSKHAINSLDYFIRNFIFNGNQMYSWPVLGFFLVFGFSILFFQCRINTKLQKIIEILPYKQ